MYYAPYRPGTYKKEATDFIREQIGEEKFKRAFVSEKDLAHPAVAAKVFLSPEDWSKFVYIEQNGSLEGYVELEGMTDGKVVKYGMYSIGRDDIHDYEGVLPENVFENCDLDGCFMIGAVAAEDELVGLTQFYIDIDDEGNFKADILYIFVDDDFKESGAALSMIKEVHSILQKSNVKTSVTHISEKDMHDLFLEAGYKDTDNGMICNID